jgi:hypothetical protein
VRYAAAECVAVVGQRTGSGTVNENGTIRVGDSDYPSPSAAGLPAVGHTVDGWVKWRVPSLGNHSLADLRVQFLELRAADEEFSK